MSKNDDRLIKRGSRVFRKSYVAKKKSINENKDKSNKPFIGLLILIFILGLSYNLLTHPFMKIQDIYVSGNIKTSDTEIIKKLRGPLGKNILLYDPLKNEGAVEKLPYVEKAEVRKVFPKILSVRVKEEFPLYKIENKDLYITNTGLISRKAENPEGLIKIKPGPVEESEGQAFTSSETRLEFIKKISDSSLASSLSYINLENKLDIGIMLKDIEVKFGDLNNISKKIKLLEKVLADINNKGLEVESINLNNGDNPLVVVDENSFSDDLNK